MADAEQPIPIQPDFNSEEEDVCRVCRVEGDDEEPLIYPCKCSGSVRFVHPDCLKSWLSHSQKKYCEICGHKYTFTKVYPDYIPSVIPSTVYARQTVFWIYRIACYITRFWMAVMAWLIVLPSINMITLRCLLWVADMSYAGTGEIGSSLNGTTTSTANLTSIVNVTQNSTTPLAVDFLLRPVDSLAQVLLTTCKSWYRGEENTLPGFVFRGQILSIVITAVLIGLILLREWITQHNWAQHLATPTEVIEEIDPDQWVVQRGVAHKIEDLVVKTRQKAERMAHEAEMLKLLRQTAIQKGRTQPTQSAPLSPAVNHRSIDSSEAQANGSTSLPSTPNIRELDFPIDAATDPQGRTRLPPLPRDEDEAGPSVSPSGRARPAGLPRMKPSVAYTAPELLEGENNGESSSSRLDHGLNLDFSGAKGKEREVDSEEVPNLEGVDAAPAEPQSTEDQEEHDWETSSNASERTVAASIDLPPLQPVQPLPEDRVRIGDEIIAVERVRPRGVRRPRREPDRLEEVAALEQAEEEEIEREDWDRMREDWDGVLEVIGLIGPMSNLFQNLIFAIIIMGAALSVLVGGPIIIGKVSLSIDIVKSIGYTSHQILRLIRAVFDPVFDIALEITKDVIITPLLSSFQALETILARTLGLSGSSSVKFPQFDWPRIAMPLLDHLRKAYETERAFSHRLAESAELSDRVWTMLRGYAVVFGSVGLLALAGESNLGRLSSGILGQIRQHTAFIKLALFMGIELLVFPIVIGVVLDVCTLPLFEDASISSRAQSWSRAPFGMIFMTWLVGTMFMFAFAAFLSHVRKCSRPGAMFFVRDPSDPSFSPVKEIVEKPATTQLRKLSVSAIMYAIVASILFGFSSWTLSYQTLYPILPLRTKNFAPLSSVPFDLLFLHLVVPPTVKRLKLDKRAKKLWLKYWIMSTEAFCLSGLLRFTVRDWKVKEETGPRALERLWPVLHPIVRFCFGPYRLEATQARVPAADTVAVLPLAERRKGGVFIPLNEWGAPKTPEDKMRLLKQDRRARQLHRDPKYDYDVVWLPKYWQTRIYAYIFTTIAAVAIVISLCFFVPLILGRFVLDPFGKNPLHDGYNFIAGVYLCILWGWASGQVDKLVLRLTSADQIRRSKRSVRVKRSILKFVRKVSMLVLLFGVTPTVFGLVFELYIALPGKYGLDKTATPVLHLWDAWAIGAVSLSLLSRIIRAGMIRRREIRMDVAAWKRLALLFQRPFDRTHVDPHRTIMMFLMFLMMPIFLPMLPTLFAVLLQPKVSSGSQTTAVIFRTMYPLTLIFVSVLLARRAVMSRLARIKQKMVDAEYVLEEKIENYEPEVQDKDKGKEKVEVVTEQGAIVLEEDTGEWEDEGEDEDSIEIYDGSGLLDEGDSDGEVETEEDAEVGDAGPAGRPDDADVVHWL